LLLLLLGRLRLVLGEAPLELQPKRAPLLGNQEFTRVHLHLLTGRCVLQALLDQLEHGISLGEEALGCLGRVRFFCASAASPLWYASSASPGPRATAARSLLVEGKTELSDSVAKTKRLSL